MSIGQATAYRESQRWVMTWQRSRNSARTLAASCCVTGTPGAACFTLVTRYTVTVVAAPAPAHPVALV
ncbi:MAG: hypothetical protein JO242_16150, partial [Streptosporangiaceae bacterium]|nr:hypothetical protein [Streptosporangiaceae bacterium]